MTGFRVPGSRSLVWSRSAAGAAAVELQVPCGQCLGCRLSKANEWKLRCVHEAKCHQANCFLTLTYDDDHLPDDYSVSLEDYQKFLKRLRKFLGHDRVRFIGCGEYGDKGRRPHYHFIIFGYDFPDRKPWRKSASGRVSFRSETLEKLWTLGHAEVGLFSPEAAGYVARYTLKKVSAEYGIQTRRFECVHPLTGQLVTQRREFATMSKRPALGREWFAKFAGDAFPSDFLVLNGSKMPVPKYYRKLLAAQDEIAALSLKAKRVAKARLHADNNTPDRLAVREAVQSRRIAMLKRDLEGSSSDT